MIISQILEKNLKDKKIYTSNKNFNWELWLSLSILWISDYEPEFFSILKTIFKSLKISLFWKKLYDIIILEYGIDHIWEMDFLLSIVKPDIWIVTKIDKVHSSQFESKEIIASQKYKLLENTLTLSFLNFDDEFSKIYEDKITSKKLFYTTDINQTQDLIDIKWLNYELKYMQNTIKSSFDFYFKNKKKINITSNLIWEENVWYINIWLCILDELFSKYYKKTFFVLDDLKMEINFTLQYSRFSLFEWIWNSFLIDSSYNAAPESMKKVIENFVRLQKNVFPDYKIILCLGEMRELWEYAKTEHENLAQMVKNITQEIYIVWQSMKDYFLPIFPESIHFENSKLLWAFLKEKLEKTSQKYLILFKWSQNTIFMEEALKQILVHENDKNKICRQENFWIEKKQKFFDK